MADEAKLDFLATNGTKLCTLTVYVQGNWQPPEPDLEPLLTVSAAQALANGEGQVQLLEGLRYEYEL